MKALTRSVFCLFIIVMFFITSCHSVVLVHDHSKKVPPGQMKKATGSKSAKPYAPGQQKKN